jgi:hypothetical protein
LFRSEIGKLLGDLTTKTKLFFKALSRNPFGTSTNGWIYCSTTGGDDRRRGGGGAAGGAQAVASGVGTHSPFSPIRILVVVGASTLELAVAPSDCFESDCLKEVESVGLELGFGFGSFGLEL